MSNELSEYEILLTNMNWDNWYVGYVVYRKERNANYEYSISLTSKKKRQLMSDWIRIHILTFVIQIQKQPHTRFIVITYGSRSKGKRPWKATHGRKHVDYYKTFEQVCEALKEA